MNMVTESKVTEALEQMVKEWSTLKGILQTKKVTENQCCNSLLDYLFSPTGKHFMINWSMLLKKIARSMKTTLQRKRKTQYVFAYQLPSRECMLEK